jgi:hypothetical protein
MKTSSFEPFIHCGIQNMLRANSQTLRRPIALPVLLALLALLSRLSSQSLPQGMPSALVSPTPRMMVVYGGIPASYVDTHRYVDDHGVVRQRDSVRRRTQCVSSAPTISGGADTLFCFSTVGLLALDVPRSHHGAPARFSGRETSSGLFVDLYRHLGFWHQLDTADVSSSGNANGNTASRFWAYPNPFSQSTVIRLRKGHGHVVAVRVYGSDSRHVVDLVPNDVGAGEEEYLWNGRDQQGRETATGCYVVQALIELDGHATWTMESTLIIKMR